MLSEEWEESKRREESSLSDCGDNEGPLQKKTKLFTSDAERQSSSLPTNPPGQTFFVNPPVFITELYPPCCEEDSADSALFSKVESNLLNHQDPLVLKNIICSDWLRLCYLEKPCPPYVWQWLFQIMCRSHDQELCSGAFKSLTSLIQIAKHRQDVVSILIPSLSDLKDILIHLGAPSSVLSVSTCEPVEEDGVFDVAPPMQNLSYMLQYLVICLKSGLESCYSIEDIETLIMLLVRLSLDHHVCGELIEWQVSLCIAALVGVVPDDQWEGLFVKLVSKITALSEHHHDKLYMTRLISGTSKRLHHLQKELCRKSLEQLIELEESRTSASGNCHLIRCVVEHFLKQQRSESFEDYYAMYSVFSLVTLLMHPAEMLWPSAQEKKELSILLGNLSSTRIRDNPEYPERSVVKDLVIRLMLEVKSQKDKTAKQQDLFAYVS